MGYSGFAWFADDAFVSLIYSIGTETVDLLDKLLIINPKQRITASEALDHEYFWTDPMPADPKTCVSFLWLFAPYFFLPYCYENLLLIIFLSIIM